MELQNKDMAVKLQFEKVDDKLSITVNEDINSYSPVYEVFEDLDIDEFIEMIKILK